ncbi:MAG: endolytic transglycosylase MltG [Candidatus Berkelbacteria bacterium]
MNFSKKTKIVFAIVIFVLVAMIGAAFWSYRSIEKIAETPFDTGQPKIFFEIPEGSSKQYVSKELQGKGLISSTLAFDFFSRLNQKPFKAGFWEIPEKVSIFDLIRFFTTGENFIERVTIPEGWRREQIGRALEKKNIVTESSFDSASSSYEGQLFPATYFIKPGTPAADIVQMMVKEFYDQTQGLEVSDDDIILASIVERETDRAEEKSIIAGIYFNRLKIDMKLQADPTGIYAKDTIAYNALARSDKIDYLFWKAISISELNSLSLPYNTYYSFGLPEGPICNPSLETLKAVKNYQKTDYLYFQHVKGVFYPAKTYAEHLANGKK